MSQMHPYPANADLKKQGVAVPGSDSAATSSVFKNGYWDNSLLRYNEEGKPQARSLYEIFESSVKRHPNLAMFRKRTPIPPTKPGQPMNWANTTIDTSYAHIQARRNALGSALLSLERLGRLRDPRAPADQPSPPEITYDGIPSYGDKLNQGARRGWAVGIWAPNREEWQVVDLACQAYGLVSISLYETLGPDTAKYITNHAPLPIIFASANHLTDVLKIAPQCPTLRALVTMDAVSAAERDVLTQWAGSLGITFLDMDEFEQWGCQKENHIAPGPPAGEEELDAERIATISYTSGTTGNPKGVILTNWNMTSATISTAYGVTNEFSQEQGWKFLSYLPLAHVYERFLQILVIHGDGTICFTTGDTLRLLEDAQIIKPNFFPGVPRVWNRLHSAIMIQMDTPGLKGALLRRAVTTKLQNFRATGSIHHRVYDALVFRKLRNMVGGEVKYMTSGAAPLAAPVHELLKIAFSCDVIQGYGMTETVGTCTKGIPEDNTAMGTVGQIQPCNEATLFDVPEMGYTHKDKPNPRGELCLRGDNIFKGYLHDLENTAKTIDADGWMHTGDIAEVDSYGRVKIIDRVKNVVKLSQGEYVALEKIEGVYALNPIFATLLVHADSLRSSLVAVAVLEPQLASDLVNKVLGKSIPPTDTAALEQVVLDPKIRSYLLADLAKVAKKNKLNGYEYIRGIYPRITPFEDDLLTPTQKIKRNIAAKRFEKEIDDMYNQHEGVTAKL